MAGKYRVNWYYISGAGGPWMEGDVVELEEDRAEHINRDSPGVLAKLGGIRGKKAPAQDRMVKEANNRGKAEDQQSNFGAMSTDDFKAVKDG